MLGVCNQEKKNHIHNINKLAIKGEQTLVAWKLFCLSSNINNTIFPHLQLTRIDKANTNIYPNIQLK